METIKIWFDDLWPEWNVEDFITPILNKHYNVVLDQKNPDVLFHSIFNRMVKTPTYKCKKILILAENWRHKQFNSDYSISFDKPTETNFRLPLWQMYLLLNSELKDRLFNRTRFEYFDRFCAFTVSNSSNNLRNNHFDLLNNYMKVHAYGKVRLNNLELQKFSLNKYWRDAKDQYFLNKPHKFMMAYENSSYPGYCTEKLMDAFLVGSMPIYWGCTNVEEDWNSKAFINVNKNQNWLDLIKDMMQNQSVFDEYYNQPIFTDDQKQKHLENLQNFEQWLVKIVK